jgi:hypothetical protein
VNIRIDIYIYSFDYTKNEYLLLLQDNHVLSKYLDCNNIKEFCNNITNNLFDTKTDWINFKLIDVYTEEQDLVIIYGCLVPSVISGEKYKWENIGNILDENIKQTIMQILQKTIY